MRIRPALPADVTAIHALIVELAVFELAPNEVQLTPEQLLEDGFGAQPRYRCWVAESEAGIVGMALCYPRYSTWKGCTWHLEDLIVTQSERGKGYGKALMHTFLAFACQQQAQRAEWHVLDWNQSAIDFYQAEGAELLHDWRLVRMDRDKLLAWQQTQLDVPSTLNPI